MAGSRSPLRLIAFAVAFVGLSAGGVYWAVTTSGVSWSDFAGIFDFGTAWLLALLALGVALYATDVIRYQTLGRALGETMSWRSALDAAVANFFFSWLTPGAAFGAPATIYMLRRRGMDWDAAVLIAFAKSLTGIAFLICAAAAILLAGIGPEFPAPVMAVVVPGVSVLAAALGLLLVAGLFSEPTTAAIRRAARWLERRPRLSDRSTSIIRAATDILSKSVQRLGTLRPPGLLAVLASHCLYFAVFVAIAVVIAMRLGATSIPETTGISTVFLAFSYVAPTPGAAGLSEVMAVPFFESVLSASGAVTMVLLFRALTFYLQIAVGLIYLPVVGVLADIVRSRGVDER